MRIVQWGAPERRIGSTEASGFFDYPLDDPWLFHFTTERLRMPVHEGSFSLKLVLRGHETYGFGRRRIRLSPGELMFVAAGREYSSAIDRECESLSIFLPSRTASGLWAAARLDHQTLMDSDRVREPDPIPVPFRAGPATARQRWKLEQALENPLVDAEDAVLSLLQLAAIDWRSVAPLFALTGPKRSATREELIARVIRAREMIDDQRGVGCSLDLLAEEACLSRFHLHRVFREAFGVTPGEYARHVRLTHADMLLRSGRSMPGTARATGYARSTTLGRALRCRKPRGPQSANVASMTGDTRSIV